MDEKLFWKIDSSSRHDFKLLKRHRNSERNVKRDSVINRIGFNKIADFINNCTCRAVAVNDVNYLERFKVVVLAYPTTGKTTACDVLNKVHSICSTGNHSFIVDIDSGSLYKRLNANVYIPYKNVTEYMRTVYLTYLNHFLRSHEVILLVNDFHDDVVNYLKHWKEFYNSKCIILSILPNYNSSECVRRIKDRGPYSGSFLTWIENHFDSEIPNLKKRLKEYMPVINTEYLLDFLVLFFNHRKDYSEERIISDLSSIYR